MEFFSREHLTEFYREESGLNNWCGFVKNLSDKNTQSVEESKRADNTKTYNI